MSDRQATQILMRACASAPWPRPDGGETDDLGRWLVKSRREVACPDDLWDRVGTRLVRAILAARRYDEPACASEIGAALVLVTAAKKK